MFQNEVLQDIYVDKPSFYRIVIKYVNRNPTSVTGKLKVIPETPSDYEQSLEVIFKNSSTPTYVTVSRVKPLVMNPGKWTVSIQIDKNMFLVCTSLDVM